MNKNSIMNGFGMGEPGLEGRKLNHAQAPNSGNVWSLRGFLTLCAIGSMILFTVVTLSTAWTEITIDNETYWLVPSSEVLPDHAIKGIHYPDF